MKKLLLLLPLLSCSTKIPTWGIQLQKYEAPYDLARIANIEKDLWVLDPDSMSDRDLRMIRGKKKLIAYLSLGEAEDYRSYFKNLPKEVLLAENPAWKGNFTVKFWMPSWEKAVRESLRKIIDSGFDGVFLDIIDAFDRFPDKKEKAEAMANLVRAVRAEAVSLGKKDFILIPQNGIHIRRYLSDAGPYLAAINGVNVENALMNSDNEVVEDIRYYQKHKKYVLSLEYPESVSERAKYFDRARSLKVSPLAAEKSLSGELYFPETP